MHGIVQPSSASSRAAVEEGSIVYRVLGPLAIQAPTRAITLSSPQQAALLALLLLHANRAVSADAAGEALWGAEPGRSSKRLQMAVARLRKSLEPLAADDGTPVLRTVSGGYLLAVGKGELDAELFEERLRAGRRALEARNPAAAAQLLREAEALWRGPALAECAHADFAQDEIRRLEHLRSTAIEARVEADLQLGRHAELVAELEGLVAAEPGREPLVALLMLALYRCGRQAEALEAYQALYRRLDAELGIEPGPRLQRLQAGILNHDPALEQQPRELPPELSIAHAVPLAGRERECAWLEARWRRAAAGQGGVVVLAGPPGAGKTRLAAQLAHVAFGDGAGVSYVSGLTGTGQLASEYAAARRSGAARLVVVDDADELERDTRAQIVSCSADVPVLTLVLTADDKPLGHLLGVDTLALGGLDEAAVRQIAAAYAPSGVDGVPSRRLLEASGGLPGRVHELAADWARREAARRVERSAERTAAGRFGLRSLEAELTRDIVDLQSAGGRTALPLPGQQIPVCPFKGLAAFDVTDAAFFFGRDRLIAEIVAGLVGTPLLGVIGASGSGKSSVVRAGVLPALAAGVLPGSDAWAPVVMRPGEEPPDDLRCPVGAGQFVLVVDQFEETFTMCADEGRRARFVAALTRLAAEAAGRGAIVLALRADQYGACAAYPELAALLAANHVLVAPMRRDEVRAAIECPSERAGLSVEPELTDRLVADVERQPGALPLLSTSLLELWQRRSGRELRLAAYLETGGISGAVARLAEDAYSRLEPEQRDLARQVLMCLVTESPDGAVERRRVPLADLGSAQEPGFGRVVRLLADRRLLTVTDGTAEFAHEALLREWPRLSGWIDQDLHEIRTKAQLTRAAGEWARAGRHDADLWTAGARLAAAAEWAGAPSATLDPLAREFLDASLASEQARRRARRRRIRLAVATLAVAVAAITAGWLIALANGREARKERDIAMSRELAATATSELNADPGLSLGLALLALGRSDTAQARDVLRQAAHEARAKSVRRADVGWVRGLALSRDGRTVVTGGDDGRMKIWSVAGGPPRATIAGVPGYAFNDVAIGRDGRTVAGASADGTVVVADADGRDRRVLLRGHGHAYAIAVQFSPDGRRLAVGLYDGTLHIIGLHGTSSEVLPAGVGPIADVSWSADGFRLAIGGVTGARVLDVARGSWLTLPHPQPVQGVAFAPRGPDLATAGADGRVRIWDARRGTLLRSTSQGGQGVRSVSYSRNGRALVSTDDDGIARILDARNGLLLSQLKGHVGTSSQAVFGTDDRTVLSVGQDGTLREWLPPLEAAFREPAGSLSVAGRHVVTADGDGTVRAWDLAAGTRRTVLSLPAPGPAQLGPDGRMLVAAPQAGPIEAGDLRSGRKWTVPTDGKAKTAAAINAAGSRVAMADPDGSITLESSSGGSKRTLRGAAGLVVALAFSPDGRELASGDNHGIVRLWRAADGRLLRVLRGHQGAVDSVAFSDDGHRLLSAGEDGTARVWPLGPGRRVTLFVQGGSVASAAFSPRGQEIVTAGQDGAVRVWSSSGGEPLLALDSHPGGAYAAAFTPDGGSVVSIGADAVLRVSACDVCGPIASVERIARTRADRSVSPLERSRLNLDG